MPGVRGGAAPGSRNTMRRRSGGGGGGDGPLSKLLQRHIYDFGRWSSATEDELVEYLRSEYPSFYIRTGHLKLKTQVRAAVNYLQRKNPVPAPNRPPARRQFFVEDDDDGGGASPDGRGASKKKQKRGGGGDGSEERLQEMEKARLKVIRGKPESESESESEPDSEEDGTVSTSGDDIYSQKLTPRRDLLKSQTREDYISRLAKPSEKNVELELPAREKSTATTEAASAVAEAVVGRSGGGGLDGEKACFRDFGGMANVIRDLEEEVILPLLRPELPQFLGTRPQLGLLLHGPPGCGKTRLAHAIANEAGVPMYTIAGPELVSGVSGSSEENIRDIFSKARRTTPCVVFIDEIDAIASKRENLQREMEKRIVTQLLICMDESNTIIKPTSANSKSELPDSSPPPSHILVIGATNRPDALDSALRRPGRFDREIELRVPDEKARAEILSVLCKKLKLEGSIDLHKIARSTPGFVGADLVASVSKAGNLAMKRIAKERKSKFYKDNLGEEHDRAWMNEPFLPEELEKHAITMQDFEEAVELFQSSSKREGFSEIPDVKWEDVGGLDFLRQEFDRYIVRRIKYPELYKGFGVDLETGFLLYGPPGCGKTLIAKAVANEAGANFIYIQGPELLSKYVGDSEKAIRTLFDRARICSPCIVFFDEVDSITTQRGQEGGWVVERMLTQLLVELDGADKRCGVFVIGATNRPDAIDRALLRPGRFSKQVYVPLPGPNDRSSILKAVARNKPVDASVDFNAIAEACENFSGADLAALVNEAALAALEDASCNQDGAPQMSVLQSHFELGLTKIKPSVTVKQTQKYQKVMNFTVA